MKTIALRYADHFAPVGGTIKAHEELIKKNGFVWYGKIGIGISENTRRLIMSNSPALILLVHSGCFDRYWATISDIKKEIPEEKFIPGYYKDKYDKVGVWFCVTRFQKASSNVLSKCKLISSGKTLTEASRKCMNPMFIIECMEFEK